jgi:hypothetical protein
MNDPHIEALHYSVRHAKGVDYDNARPLDHDTPGFTVHIENGRAEITMKTHHATVDAARTEVEPSLRAWELTAALEFGPGDFRLVYDQAKIIDRNPTPGIVNVPVPGAAAFSAAGALGVHVGRSKYPDPPTGIARDATVDLMFERYCWYCTRRTTLADAVNFCMTVLEMSGGGRKGATKRFAVAKPVLDNAGKLAANKGGNEARKAKGAQAEFTAAERHWLEETMKRLILRAGEVAAGNAPASLPQITMADLPPLSKP